MGMRHLNTKSRSFSCCGSLHAFACQLVTSNDDRVLFRRTYLHAERITVDLLEVVLSLIELAYHSDAPNCDKWSGVRWRHTANVNKYCCSSLRSVEERNRTNMPVPKSKRCSCTVGRKIAYMQVFKRSQWCSWTVCSSDILHRVTW